MLTSKNNFKVSATASGTAYEYSPKSMKVSWESLSSESSGRTDDGVMHID